MDWQSQMLISHIISDFIQGSVIKGRRQSIFPEKSELLYMYVLGCFGRKKHIRDI